MLQVIDKTMITISNFRKTETKVKECTKCKERYIVNKFGDGIRVNGKTYFDCPYCKYQIEKEV